MTLIITLATLRDISFIAANMRAADQAELRCQIKPGLDPKEVALQIAQHSSLAWCAVRNDQPIACFGCLPTSYVCWQLWAFGTKDLWRAVPAISKHLYDFGPTLMDMGARRLEVRAWKGHDLAPLWLRAVGCTHVTDLSDHGIAGEVFELWEWTASDYLDGSMQARREKPHVLRSESAQAAETHPATNSRRHVAGG